MRIRGIKPDFFTDENIGALTDEEKLAFIGLWIIADKKGRLLDHPESIRIKIFPYEIRNMNEILIQLTKKKKYSEKPFILRYLVNGTKYIQILEFSKHQYINVREPDSVIPPIPETEIYDAEEGTITNKLEEKYELEIESEEKKEMNPDGKLVVKKRMSGHEYTEFVTQFLENFVIPEQWKEFFPNVNFSLE